jgi:leucine dehydrogenase
VIFETVRSDGFEQIIFCHDPEISLRAIIAIHSTVLGPALGGCRMWNYGNEQEALTDVLRLAKGMTYKNSLAGLNWGGAKTVLWGNPKTQKSQAMLTKFAKFVDGLGGRYITAKDVGIGAADLRMMRSVTPFVVGIDGMLGSSGDPSISTAWGVYHGMRAVAQFAFGISSLSGLKIALQGLGSVSFSLLEHLCREGAKIIGCDIDEDCARRACDHFPIEIVPAETIYDVECDIFSPSALGGILNEETLPRLKTRAIAGAANNQLANSNIGRELFKRKIIYAPDYAINAGGVINIAYENSTQKTYDLHGSRSHTQKIYHTVLSILERSHEEQKPTHVIADQMAMERILKKQLSQETR